MRVDDIILVRFLIKLLICVLSVLVYGDFGVMELF